MWKSPEPAPALLPITLRTYSPSLNYNVTEFLLRNRNTYGIGIFEFPFSRLWYVNRFLRVGHQTLDSILL